MVIRIISFLVLASYSSAATEESIAWDERCLVCLFCRLFLFPGGLSLLLAAASWHRLQNGMREAPGAGAGKTNELVVSLNVFISQPAR